MPGARGVKRTASKASTTAAAALPKNKKKRGVVQLEVPAAPKRRGRVLTCGQGDVGQLGLGDDVMETTKFKHVSLLKDNIVDVCAGGMHTVALDADGKVWTFGCNDEGALGRATSSDQQEMTPGCVHLPGGAAALCAGDSHTAALLEDGRVYVWGAFRDSHGSMGLVMRGKEGKPSVTPELVALPEQAAAIASGQDHLVVLTASGAVYTLGCGEQGQLGRLAQRSASRDSRQGFSALLTPARVSLKFPVSKIWAGFHGSVAVDANTDKVYAWGLNNYGQLGITGEKRKSAIFSPTECDAFTAVGGEWAQVCCGQHHSVARDSAGRVYTVGRCEYGRLGLGTDSEDAETLSEPPALRDKKCVCVSAGTSSSFAVTQQGEVFGWGMGSEGQLGTGTSSDQHTPTLASCAQLQAWQPSTVAAGGQHTVLLAVSTKESSPEAPAAALQSSSHTVHEDNAQDKPEDAPAEKTTTSKRGKRKPQEQEGEVSSTSSNASAATKRQKVNGDDNKDTKMDVDETDKPGTEPEKKVEDTKPSPPTDVKPDAAQDDVKTDTDSQDSADITEHKTEKTQDKDNKDDITEDKTDDSQDSADVSEDNADVTQVSGDVTRDKSADKLEDVEMKEVPINGTPEDKVESKKAENVQSVTTIA